MGKEQQLSLFPEPELFYSSLLEPQERKVLEDIALEASLEPLLFGEEQLLFGKNNSNPERRFTKMISYISGNIDSVCCYLIKYDSKLIGGVYIWDGWLPLEGAYTIPGVELAFISRRYKEYEPLLKQKIGVAVALVYESQQD